MIIEVIILIALAAAVLVDIKLRLYRLAIPFAVLFAVHVVPLVFDERYQTLREVVRPMKFAALVWIAIEAMLTVRANPG